MANADNGFGFEPIVSAGKEVRVRYYPKDTSAIIYRGAPLKLQAAGDVIKAAAGDALVGIAAETRPAADTEIAVYDDPEQEFIAQCSGAYAAADFAQNADYVTAAADTVRNRAADEIDTSSFATTATLQFKLLDLHDHPDNAVGSYAIVRCKINNHVLKGGTGTAGV